MDSLFEKRITNFVSADLMIKVCGMREEKNIEEVKRLTPDFMGLIFYPKSLRYVGDVPLPYLEESFSPVRKVGVFVNEAESVVLDRCKAYGLDVVQLHGDESVDYCVSLRKKGLHVIKAFGISEKADLKKCGVYASACDAFLFDTKCVGYGGAGVRFDWNILGDYTQEVPFLLSGGISEEDVDEIKSLRHPFLVGVDLNSRFELAPALKDVPRLKRMMEKIRG